MSDKGTSAWWRRAVRWFNRTFNVFAIVYVAGLAVMIGPAQNGLGWPFARAVTWVLGVPLFYAWGIHDQKRYTEDKS